MKRYEAFGTYHPIINFVFFAAALVFGMIFLAPAFLVLAMGFSALYYLTVKGRDAGRTLLSMLGVFVALSLINPLFNTLGDTILFTYFNERPYTLQALFYGMAIGAMLVTMLLWFFSYNAIMTSDKFTFLFGRVIPSTSLVFTMVLRFVPTYQRKISQFAVARKSIGKSLSGGSLRDKVTNGVALVSMLTTWAFENAIVTADSMRSRGYGLPGRVSYSIYRFGARDKILLVIMVALIVITAYCGINGAAAIEYTPIVVLPPTNGLFWTGVIAYGIFLAIPSLINIGEYLIWHISLSKI